MKGSNLVLGVLTLLTSINLGLADPLDQWAVPDQSPWITPALFAVTHGNSRFVAVGNASINGQFTGSVVTFPDGSGGYFGPGTGGGTNGVGGRVYGDFLGIVYARNLFAVVGSGGRILTSPDGFIWTDRTGGYRGSSVVTTNDLYAIAYGNGEFVAVGDHGTIVRSPDGIAWSGHDSGANAKLVAIAYGTNQFVASGDTLETFDHGIVLTSRDGTEWTIEDSEFYAGLAYGEGQFVGVGGVISTSPDGVHWTYRPYLPRNATFYNLDAVAYGNHEFVAIGQMGAIVTSPDGVAWTNRASGTTEDLTAVAYGNNSFVVVSYFGAILQSGVLPQPMLGSLRLLPSGAMQVTITGPPGRTYPVQASTNLTDWLALTNVTLTNESAMFIDPSAPNFGRRFYRAGVD